MEINNFLPKQINKNILTGKREEKKLASHISSILNKENGLSPNEEKRILKKIARGEKLTSKEVEKLKKIDPEKARQAQTAKMKKDELEKKLKNAKSKEEANKILSQAENEAHASMDKNNNLYSELLLAAIDKAKTNARLGKREVYTTGRDIDLKI